MIAIMRDHKGTLAKLMQAVLLLSVTPALVEDALAQRNEPGREQQSRGTRRADHAEIQRAHRREAFEAVTAKPRQFDDGTEN